VRSAGRNSLVFLHGAGGTSHGWDLQRLAFPAAVAPDLPGHDGEGQGYRQVEDYARWLRATGQAHEWFPGVLAGHSMGGAIALWYALSWPEDLAGIVLMATGARLRVAPEILTGVAADYPAAVDAIIARSLDPGDHARLAARLREAMLAVPQAVTAGDFQACDAFDVRGRLGEIRTPALVIAGAGGSDDAARVRRVPPRASAPRPPGVDRGRGPHAARRAAPGGERGDRGLSGGGIAWAPRGKRSLT